MSSNNKPSSPYKSSSGPLREVSAGGRPLHPGDVVYGPYPTPEGKVIAKHWGVVIDSKPGQTLVVYTTSEKMHGAASAMSFKEQDFKLSEMGKASHWSANSVYSVPGEVLEKRGRVSEETYKNIANAVEKRMRNGEVTATSLDNKGVVNSRRSERWDGYAQAKHEAATGEAARMQRLSEAQRNPTGGSSPPQAEPAKGRHGLRSEMHSGSMPEPHPHLHGPARGFGGGASLLRPGPAAAELAVEGAVLVGGAVAATANRMSNNAIAENQVVQAIGRAADQLDSAARTTPHVMVAQFAANTLNKAEAEITEAYKKATGWPTPGEVVDGALKRVGTAVMESPAGPTIQNITEKYHQWKHWIDEKKDSATGPDPRISSVAGDLAPGAQEGAQRLAKALADGLNADVQLTPQQARELARAIDQQSGDGVVAMTPQGVLGVYAVADKSAIAEGSAMVDLGQAREVLAQAESQRLGLAAGSSQSADANSRSAAERPGKSSAEPTMELA